MFLALSFSLRVSEKGASASTVIVVRGSECTCHEARVSSSAGLTAYPTLARLRLVNSSVFRMRVDPRGMSARLAFKAAGFMATRTSGASPGVITSWSAK